MNAYHFTVVVTTGTEDEAKQVMGERLGHDEDYGFEYVVDWFDAARPPKANPALPATYEQAEQILDAGPGPFEIHVREEG